MRVSQRGSPSIAGLSNNYYNEHDPERFPFKSPFLVGNDGDYHAIPMSPDVVPCMILSAFSNANSENGVQPVYVLWLCIEQGEGACTGLYLEFFTRNVGYDENWSRNIGMRKRKGLDASF